MSKNSNLASYIRTTEQQHKTAVRYAAWLKRDLVKSKMRLAQRLNQAQASKGVHENAS